MLFPATFTRNASKPELIGSYGRAVPNSHGPGAGNTVPYSEFRKKDMKKTVEAMIDSGQTFFGFTADDGIAGDNSAGEYWVDFISLLNETVGTGIKIFATVRERHLIKGITNRWGITGGNRGGIAGIGVPTSNDRDSAVSWAAAATEFSALSLTYPHFVGFSVDDFGPVMDPVFGGYTEVEIENITIAAKSSNSSFKFWPTQYFNHMLKQIIPSTVIGMTIESNMIKDEYVATEYSFDISFSPDTAVVSFLFNDANNEEEFSGLYKKFFINGTEIYSEDWLGHSFIEYFNSNITEWVVSGTNVLRIEVVATKYINEWANKLLYIENPRIEIDGKLVSYIQTFDVMESYQQIDSVAFPDKTGLIITRPPELHKKFASKVDGFFAVYANKSKYVNNARFLCKKYKTAIGKKELHYVEQAYLYGEGIVPDHTVDKFESVSDIVSSTLAWNWPIDIFDPSGGVFKEKVPTGLGDFAILCIWPERHSGIPGWSQRWVSNEKYTGSIDFKLKDNINTPVPAPPANTTELFNKKIYTSDGIVLYDDGTYEEEGPGPYTAESFTFDVGAAPVNIIFETSLVESVGNVYLRVEFGMNPGSGWLANDDFTFGNNTVDTDVSDAYTEIRNYFKRPRWER